MTEPTPIQRGAIPSVLMGRDLIGIAQTGTGKTAGFVLPMIDILAQGRSRARMPRSLILEPTRELAAQVAENFEKYGKYHKLSMALLIGGVQMGDQVKALEKGVDVLIATPGRLMDLFGRGKIMLNGCELLVIDEADRMLDMGFIPDIEEICSKLPKSAADPALLGDHAAADQEAGRQVPERPQDDRGRPARHRQRQYRAAAGRCPRATRSATRCATSCAARSSRTRSSSATARSTVRELCTSLKRSGFAVGQIQGDMDQSRPHRRVRPLQERTRSTSSSRPTSRRAGSTSKASATSSTSTCRGSPTITSTASAAPAAPGMKGIAITLATRDDARPIAAIEKLTGIKLPRGDGERGPKPRAGKRDRRASRKRPRKPEAARAPERAKRAEAPAQSAEDRPRPSREAPAKSGRAEA